jgi:hypothetical protein
VATLQGQLAELDKAILDLESQKVDETMQEVKIEIRQREKNRTNEIFPGFSEFSF